MDEQEDMTHRELSREPSREPSHSGRLERESGRSVSHYGRREQETDGSHLESPRRDGDRRGREPPHLESPRRDGDRRGREPPRFDRVFKSFKIESFSGAVTPGAFDAGAAAWFSSFSLQLSMEEDIHGVYLSETAKNALFFRSLSGHARDWYIANKDTLRSRSLETLGRRLKREFGNRLTRLQVCELVANERKKPSETYHQFSLRLRAMAAATSPNGSETVESNNLALSGFLVNAWNRHTDALRMVVREDSEDPLREMDRAIRRLCALAKHHGALPVRSAQTLNTGKRKAPDSASRDRAPKAGKHNSSSDRKSNPGKLTRKDYSNARCGECGEYGHTTGYHDTFVRRQQGAARAASSMVATMQQPVPTAPADSEEDDEPARTVANEII